MEYPCIYIDTDRMAKHLKLINILWVWYLYKLPPGSFMGAFVRMWEKIHICMIYANRQMSYLTLWAPAFKNSDWLITWQSDFNDQLNVPANILCHICFENLKHLYDPTVTFSTNCQGISLHRSKPLAPLIGTITLGDQIPLKNKYLWHFANLTWTKKLNEPTKSPKRSFYILC